MGMFDWVWCKMPLPEGRGGPEVEFQTKDYECSLWDLEIRADGTMWRKMSHDVMQNGGGRYSEHPEQVIGSGIVVFYGDGEFLADFKDGIVQEIRLAPWSGGPEWEGPFPMPRFIVQIPPPKPRRGQRP